MSLQISKNANPNYLAKVVKLKGLQKHPGADRLQTVVIDFQTVITGMEAKEGDIYIYFPVECTINTSFLSITNSFRDKTFNDDSEKTGFFESNGRVKAVRLRGEQSCGYLVPKNVVEDFANFLIHDSFVGTEFDTINGIKLLEKYVIKESVSGANKNKTASKLSRLIEGQVRLHVDTENLRKNVHKIKPSDLISVTYKTHGTSYWVGNVLVKKQLNWFEKLAKKIGLNIVDTEYDLIYGSRNVVKNKSVEDPKNKEHFYGYDLWKDIKDEIGHTIPKGYTIYGEYLGFDKNGKHIQKNYDYGCKPNSGKIEVYRITHTTPDGIVTELNNPQIREFCSKNGLNASYFFYFGEAKELYPDLKAYLGDDDLEDWHRSLISRLEKDFNEKPCFMCANKVPEEGIVLRKESLFHCESYKLKSFAFLEAESKELDKGEKNIEDES